MRLPLAHPPRKVAVGPPGALACAKTKVTWYEYFKKPPDTTVQDISPGPSTYPVFPRLLLRTLLASTTATAAALLRSIARTLLLDRGNSVGLLAFRSSLEDASLNAG